MDCFVASLLAMTAYFVRTPYHMLPPLTSCLLKKRTSMLLPWAGGEARRDLNEACSPGLSVVCSSTLFQA